MCQSEDVSVRMGGDVCQRVNAVIIRIWVSVSEGPHEEATQKRVSAQSVKGVNTEVRLDIYMCQRVRIMIKEAWKDVCVCMYVYPREEVMRKHVGEQSVTMGV